MNNSSDIVDEKSSKNLDKTNVYSDIDGTFDCILIKYDGNNQNILDQIQMIIIHEEESKYSLLLQKSNDEPIVDVTDSNIELVKSKFDSAFHNLTGNYWKYRDQFSRTRGNYYLFSNDLDLSSSSEEQKVGLNQINKIPKFYSTERAFFNFQTNAIEKTYTYVNDGADWEITLPDISRENEIISALLNVRKSVVRIATLYERDSTAQIFFGSGFLLTDRIVLTSAHNFDVIVWADEKVCYSRIYVCFCDPANETLFSLSNPSPRLREAKLIRRGLKDDNICDYDQIKCDTADLSLLELNNPATHLQPDEYFDPK